jgi:hypothetical protein
MPRRSESDEVTKDLILLSLGWEVLRVSLARSEVSASDIQQG